MKGALFTIPYSSIFHSSSLSQLINKLDSNCWLNSLLVLMENFYRGFKIGAPFKFGHCILISLSYLVSLL